MDKSSGSVVGDSSRNGADCAASKPLLDVEQDVLLETEELADNGRWKGRLTVLIIVGADEEGAACADMVTSGTCLPDARRPLVGIGADIFFKRNLQIQI
jgi:hypothetical protein